MISLLQSQKFVSLFSTDALLISGKDLHQLDHPLDIFMFRHIISGFNGSAGTLVMYKDGTSALWTDGRYQESTRIIFSQHKHVEIYINTEDNFEDQIHWIFKKHTITALSPQKTASLQSNTPVITENLTIPSIGICLWQYTDQQYSEIKKHIRKYSKPHSPPILNPLSLTDMLANITIILKKPLCSHILLNFSRSPLEPFIAPHTVSFKKHIYHSSENISQAKRHKNIVIYKKKYHEKIIKKIISLLKKEKASYFITANIHEIAYITGMRANIIQHLMIIPSFLCAHRYPTPSTALDKLDISLFLPKTLIHNKIASSLKEVLRCTIHIKPYESLLTNTKKTFANLFLSKHKKTLVYNSQCLPSEIIQTIEQHHTNLTIKKITSPFLVLKSICPKEDIPTILDIHKNDCAALLKAMNKISDFLAQGIPISEQRAAQIIKKEKSLLKSFLQESFESISASGRNAILPHYNYKDSTAKSFLLPSIPYLIDCGAHYSLYNEGNKNWSIATTDITRVFFFHSLIQKSHQAPLQLKKDYTAVLKAHIALATYVCDTKTSAVELDSIARTTLHKIGGREYLHGTGHGIGCGTDVHEGVQNISPKSQCKKLYPHMLITNEPGFYPTRQSKKYWGIRLENVYMLLKHSHQNAKLQLSPLSFFPFQNSLIIHSSLTQLEKSWLHQYQKTCKDYLYPILSKKTRAFLETLLL